MGSECSRKKRTISLAASGPRGSVKEPAGLPPDHACAAPWISQCSKTARPLGSVWQITNLRKTVHRGRVPGGHAFTRTGERSLIAGITRQVMREYLVDPQRVYIGGLSAGAAAAAITGATYPDLYAAIGVHSGLACGAANDLPSAFVAMRQGDLADVLETGRVSPVLGNGPAVPTIVFHGDRDTTVHPRNGDHVIARSMSGALRPSSR